MTDDELQAHIKALNDAAAAGEIEWELEPGHWQPIARTFLNYSYRIKPKPREVWIHELNLPTPNQDGAVTSLWLTNGPGASDIAGVRILFREVVSE